MQRSAAAIESKFVNGRKRDHIAFWPGTSGLTRAFPFMRTTSNIILAGLVIAASGAAIAQAPPAPATPPQQTAPPSPQHATDCSPADRARGAATPDGTTTGQSREPLGDKLAKSDGVLCPPAGVDPEMHAPAPSTDGSHARHPAPRQPRRRPLRQAEIGAVARPDSSSSPSPVPGRVRRHRRSRSREAGSRRVRSGKRRFRCQISPNARACLAEALAKRGLTARRPLPYMPRVREIGLFGPRDPVAG